MNSDANQLVSLPLEMIHNVCSFLEFDDLLQARAVSVEWNGHCIQIACNRAEEKLKRILQDFLSFMHSACPDENLLQVENGVIIPEEELCHFEFLNQEQQKQMLATCSKNWRFLCLQAQAINFMCSEFFQSIFSLKWGYQYYQFYEFCESGIKKVSFRCAFAEGLIKLLQADTLCKASITSQRKKNKEIKRYGVQLSAIFRNFSSISYDNKSVQLTQQQKELYLSHGDTYQKELRNYLNQWLETKGMSIDYLSTEIFFHAAIFELKLLGIWSSFVAQLKQEGYESHLIQREADARQIVQNYKRYKQSIVSEPEPEPGMLGIRLRPCDCNTGRFLKIMQKLLESIFQG